MKAILHWYKKKSSNCLRPQEEGQGLVEYALILVLVAVVAIAALLLLGPVLEQTYSNVVCHLDLGSDVSGVMVNGDPPNVEITVHIRRPTTITISGDASGGGTCDHGPCTYTLSLTGSGTLNVQGINGCKFAYDW